MTTRIGSRVIFPLMVLLFVAVQTAHGQYRREPQGIDLTPEGRPLRITLEVGAGSVQLSGGLQVRLGVKGLFLGPLLSGTSRTKVEVYIQGNNRTGDTVWLDAEIRVPGEEKVLKELLEIKKGKRKWHAWEQKEVVWNVEYPVTVSVFADKERKKVLGAKTTSFVFDNSHKEALEHARAFVAEQVRQGMRLTWATISGWRDEQAAAEGRESAEELVEGTLADAALQADVKKMISMSESALHPGCELQIVKQLRSSSKPGWERWSVKTCDVTSEYDVVMIPSPKGGTDVKVTKKVKEERAQGAVGTPPVREQKPAERKGEPPFEWDDTFSSPGTSLAIIERGRSMKGRQGTTIMYEIRATGFVDEEGLSLWLKNGTEYSEPPFTLSSNGVVYFLKSTTDFFMIGGYVLGQALDLALYSKTTNKRAHAKVIPFPIQAQGIGGCSASAEIMSESGFVFLIRFQGFQPKQEVEILSQYKKEKAPKTVTASERGQIQLPIMFGPGDRGTATATATSKDCTVSLQYKIGKDALRSQ